MNTSYKICPESTLLSRGVITCYSEYRIVLDRRRLMGSKCDYSAPTTDDDDGDEGLIVVSTFERAWSVLSTLLRPIS